MLIERKREKKEKSRHKAFVWKFYVPLAKRYKPGTKRGEERKEIFLDLQFQRESM